MRLRSFLVSCFGLAWTSSFSIAAEPAASQNTITEALPARAVIELFTSQGCSSCPPADVLLKSYSKDPSIIALSLPVDYWDYLGWKDTFANHNNSERQRSYAKVRGDGAIYTPQAVVNGLQHVNGSSKAEIDGAIEHLAKTSGLQNVPIRFWQERNTLNVAIGARHDTQPSPEATVWLGVIQASGAVQIKRGENAGMNLEYANIVRDLSPIGLWKGEPLNIQIPRGAVMMQGAEKCVILLQEGRTGPILAAALANLF